MSTSDPSSPLPRRRSWSRHRRLFLFAIVLLGCWGIYSATRPASRSVLLPDGTKITFHSVSRGKPAGQSPGGRSPMFAHKSVSNDGVVRRSWVWLCDHSPSAVARYMPYWPLRSYFQSGTWSHEFELRFLVEGSLRNRQWCIGIADDGGWETVFNEMDWFPGYPNPNPGGPHDPGQLSMPGPLPRHSRRLRIRFHPGDTNESKPTDAQKREVVAEMTIPNPIYEGPAPVSSITAGPVTRTTRFGEVTLTRAERERVVAREFGNLTLEFDVRQGGKPVTELDFYCEKITDRSGQMFWATTQGGNRGDNGHHYHYLQVAPWSDDPIWKIRMNLLRSDRCSMVEESELFRFDHLPVPQGKRTEVNRSITRDGVTFYVSAIEHTQYNDWRIGLEYWVPEGKDPKRRVLIQDARDDQGRTHRTEKNDTTPIVYGPVGGTTEGAGYSIKLAPDARWWDLTVLLETIETVEFEVRPTFIK